MHTRRFFRKTGVVTIFLFLFGGVAATGLRAETTAPAVNAAPPWQCGDWWVVEQARLDISKPTPEWKPPAQWKCEVICPQGQDLMVLEIRSLSGLQTGVDVVFRMDPWEVKKIRKIFGTADGLKVLEQEVNSRGPVMDLQSPFALVLPAFPLADTSSTQDVKMGPRTVPVNPSALGPNSGENKNVPLGMRYQTGQKVSQAAPDDPMALQGRNVIAGLRAGTSDSVSNRPYRVEMRQGRTQAVQMWNDGFPWALVEEAPNTKTRLLEFHKGVTK